MGKRCFPLILGADSKINDLKLEDGNAMNLFADELTYLLISKYSLALDENAMNGSLSRSEINTIQTDDDKRMNSMHNLPISSTDSNDDELGMNSVDKR